MSTETIELAQPFADSLKDRNPAYQVRHEFVRFEELISNGLSTSEAKQQLIKELTQARASHAAEILLAQGAEYYPHEPFIFDIDDYRLASSATGQQLAKGPSTLDEPVSVMLQKGIDHASGHWRVIAEAVKSGMNQVESLLTRAEPGQLVMLISPPEMAEKAYSFVYLFQKTKTVSIKGYAIPVWQELTTLAVQLTNLDVDRLPQSTDHLSLLRSPVIVSDHLAGTPAQVFQFITGLDRTIFHQGLAHYHQLQDQIKPQLKLDLKFIEHGIGEEVISQSLTHLQENTIKNAPGFEKLVRILKQLDSSKVLRLVLPCGVIELAGRGSQDTSVSYVHNLLIGGCKEKICRRCGTRPGDHDIKCPTCGWSP